VSAFGGRKRGNGRSDLPLNAEINVTSLVDVAFTLLVIFIITAPILQGGINVSVPKADVQPITASNKKPFFVTVNRQGQVFIEDTKTTVTEFQKSFPQLAEAGKLERVYLRADSLASYGPVLKVMATIAKSGVEWSMVAEPYQGS